jgi:hypothetical protein
LIPTRLSGQATGKAVIATSPIFAAIVIRIVSAGKILLTVSPASFRVWE